MAKDRHPAAERGTRAPRPAVVRCAAPPGRRISAEVAPEGDDPTTAQTHVLRQVSLRRLTELGFRPERAEVLVSSEPQLRDRWLAYLALALVSVIDYLIRRGGH
jgi:hypothetical protein